MTRRIIGNIVLGLALSGCTVTNTIQTTVSLSQDDDGRITAAEVLDTPTAEPSEPQEPQLPVGKRVIPNPNPPGHVREKKKGSYCDMYTPLTVPDPIKYDAKTYAEAVEVEDYAKATRVMAANVVAVNKQMREYKINLQTHHNAWKKACGKQ